MGDKIYLGDGAYAEYSGHDIAITAENGITVSNVVYLGPQELQRLFEFAKAGGMIE